MKGGAGAQQRLSNRLTGNNFNDFNLQATFTGNKYLGAWVLDAPS